MSGEKFLMEWQVTDKVIKWIFFQFILNLLQITQTQKIITHRVSIYMNGYEECVWVGKSFLWNDKWQIKLLSELFSNSLSTFYNWLKLKK